jgi:hypothetical protein
MEKLHGNRCKVEKAWTSIPFRAWIYARMKRSFRQFQWESARGERRWHDGRMISADDVDTLVFDVLGTVVDEAGPTRVGPT